MGVVAADQGAAIVARGFQRREMIFGMNLKTVAAIREVARGVKRHSLPGIAPP